MVYWEVFFQLVGFIFKSDEVIQNLFGISGESAFWVSHSHFVHYRKINLDLKKHIIENSFSVE